MTDNSKEFLRLLAVRGKTGSKLKNLLVLHVPPSLSRTWCPPAFIRVESSAVANLYARGTCA
jgi:hypothetical protein